MNGEPPTANLEQGLDQLERPSSVRVTTELMPGRQAGNSILLLNTTQSFPVHLDFGVDNLGNPITGVWRWTTEAGVDNLLKLNDVWQASYQRSDHSNAVAGTVIFPFRWPPNLIISPGWMGKAPNNCLRFNSRVENDSSLPSNTCSFKTPFSMFC